MTHKEVGSIFIHARGAFLLIFDAGFRIVLLHYVFFKGHKGHLEILQKIHVFWIRLIYLCLLPLGFEEDL
jgi:hypothetical protein